MRQTTRFLTSDGRTIYALPLEVFPNFVANVYVVCDGDSRILVDCGSGYGQANDNLLAALASLKESFGETITLSDIDKILITHAHMDHFGGLSFVRQHTAAPIGVHDLDRRVLSHYEERIVVASKQLQIFLERAGIGTERRSQLMQMYAVAKGQYRSLPVQFSLEEGESPADRMGVYHVPGHCPGQVCIEVDDILLTADHVLSRITPHQSPETITLNTGLEHYLDSLSKVEKLGHIRLALGGHEAPMEDLPRRVGEIRQAHDERLNQVLEICREPRTIADVSRELFGTVEGYTVLLALEEAGAHVEYLYLRGELIAANVEEIEEQPNPAIRYQTP